MIGRRRSTVRGPLVISRLPGVLGSVGWCSA